MVTARPFNIQNFDRKPEAAIRIKSFTHCSWQRLHAMVQSACVCKKSVRGRSTDLGVSSSECTIVRKQEEEDQETHKAYIIYQVGESYVNILLPNMGIKVSSASTKRNAFVSFFSWPHAGSDKKNWLIKKKYFMNAEGIPAYWYIRSAVVLRGCFLSSKPRLHCICHITWWCARLPAAEAHSESNEHPGTHFWVFFLVISSLKVVIRVHLKWC